MRFGQSKKSPREKRLITSPKLGLQQLKLLHLIDFGHMASRSTRHGRVCMTL